MPSVLIVYGTTDGQTAKIAEFLGRELRTAGNRVDVVRAGATPADPRDYDGVIVAASIHAGGYQHSVLRWVREHATELSAVPSAFLSVCLAVLEHSDHARHELEEIKERFIRRTGWTPATFREIAGALRYTRYGWLKRRIMRRIVARVGGDTDASRNYEYTDWNDLRAFTVLFDARLRPAPQAHFSELLPTPCVLVGAA